MILAWFSEIHDDIIPYERVIGVETSEHGSIDVFLEGKIMINVLQEEVKGFKDGFKTWLEIQQVIGLGLSEEGGEVVPEWNRKRKE